VAEVPAAAVTFLGSGSLGVPTLAALHAAGLVHAVVSQPDRPAGRGLKLVPTPVRLPAINMLPTLGVAYKRTNPAVRLVKLGVTLPVL
jgi:methionyl-tRNA formyltransferase